MTNKYIIRNCPNLTTSYYSTGETIHNQCGITDDDLCANCTHCVLKQIVELCKPIKKEYSKHKLDALIAGKFNIAGKILLLLDIQECE